MAKYNCGKYSFENSSIPKGTNGPTKYSSKAVLAKASTGGQGRASSYKLESK